MSDEHNETGATLSLLGANGAILGKKTIVKPDGLVWDEQDAVLAMWDMVDVSHLIVADADGKVTVIRPTAIAAVTFSGFIHE